MDIYSLANKARASLSSFCSNECKAYCCRKGHLVLQGKEINKVLGDAAHPDIKVQKDNTVSLNLNTSGCPSLKEYKCTIYTSIHRPKTCGDFPIYIKEKTVFLSPRCLGVKENKLYPFVRKCKSLGYNVIDSKQEILETNIIPF